MLPESFGCVSTRQSMLRQARCILLPVSNKPARNAHNVAMCITRWRQQLEKSSKPDGRTWEETLHAAALLEKR